MKQKNKIILAVILLGLLSFQLVAAQGLVPQECRRGGAAGECKLSSLRSLIFGMINYLISGAGMVAVLYVLYGGINMLRSGGSPEKVKEAKATLYNGILGFVIVMASFVIINTTISVVTGGRINGFEELTSFWGSRQP